MFNLFTRCRKPAPPRRVNFARPALEGLESRFCPSAPRITGFAATVLPDQRVELTGAVTSDSPQPVTVSFGGAVSGSVQAMISNGSGSFDLVTSNASLGGISAVAIDGENLASNAVTINIIVMPPMITASLAYGARRQVTVSGQVMSLNASGLAVSLTGVVTGSTVTDAAGHFSFTATASALGDIQVVATDTFGTQSNTAVVTVVNTKPVIMMFFASTSDTADEYYLEGQVTDEFPAGLVVTFGGATAVESVQATTGVDGSFSVAVQFPAGFHGSISAETTDWWGLTSDTVYTLIS